MEKKYRLLKNFTPRDLYEANAPIELFLTCRKRRMDNLNLPFYITYNDFVKYGQKLLEVELEPYEPWIPWLIKNKFIEEHEEDIELKPGMIIEQIASGLQYIMTNNGLYYGAGYETIAGKPSETSKECKTLQELNKLSGYQWRVLY